MEVIKPSFEDSYETINKLLNQRKYKWQLKAITWMDYEDVCQIIKFHIFLKWDKYDPSKPLGNWISTIITNQFINILRNVYLSKQRPCLQSGGCYFNLGEDGCGYTQSRKQCSECPLYAIWSSKKKDSHNIHFAVSSENHQKELYSLPSKDYDYELAESRLHEEMEKRLKKNEWAVYQLIYVQHLSDEDVAKKMGWKSKEKNRKIGYGNLARLKKIFIGHANKIRDEVDLF